MRLISLLSTAAFTVACGVQAQSTPVDTYEAYLKVSSQMLCEANLRCCGTVCKDDTDQTFYQVYTRTLHYLKEGLLSYDSQAAKDCLAGLTQRYTDCEVTSVERPIPPVCDKVLIPKSPVGGMCETGIAVCVPDAVCRNGACVALIQPGQACQQGGTACVNGSFCTGALPSVCTVSLKAGQACPTVMGCGTGLYCNTGQAPFLCALLGQDGQPCSATKPCDSAANLTCLPPGNCRPLPVPQTVREQLCSLK